MDVAPGYGEWQYDIDVCELPEYPLAEIGWPGCRNPQQESPQD